MRVLSRRERRGGEGGGVNGGKEKKLNESLHHPGALPGPGAHTGVATVEPALCRLSSLLRRREALDYVPCV